MNPKPCTAGALLIYLLENFFVTSPSKGALKLTHDNLDRNSGATVVISHRVHHNRKPEYESWLNEIIPLSEASPGFLDRHIVRPVPGITDTYSIMIRFRTAEQLKSWMTSPKRQQLIDKARPFISGNDDFNITSGLDFWFTPRNVRAKIPVRWKQYLLTWSAIYPLVLFIPIILSPLFNLLGIQHNRLLNTLAVTAVAVFLMVYMIMPRYTRLVHKWLFK
ncbi:ABM domain-containing protein [gamma proteobacterium BDW918]|nr:ABM domain-containing protein [gamma proteobacterium BDW918]MAD62706.1 antibiotic biosynthesis monooxygenase [Haliea sp.]MAT94302.1 antibiotic biosynthesis monooxygenase [Halioglobus sp.]MAV31780.1 antibiotic biosynthesis monooxygenase [Cycloclasticus sp.]MAD65615.1 antibiotic biosynthesis monooxygenase [Haliea sp.]